MQFTIKQGMNQDILKDYPDNYFDSIVTDPPYGIEFLGKDWDKNTGAVETWQECFRVLKPGGHLLAFSAARTYHHLATNIEGVGFEIRDQIMWLYASGFPKAQDIGKAIQKRQGVEETKEIPKEKQTKTAGFANNGAQEKDAWSGVETVCTSPEAKQWSGWKTALKPAHEPIVMARKPFKGSTVDNVLKHGVGALNIDATRIETDEQIAEPKRGKGVFKEQDCGWNKDDYNGEYKSNEQGRFPSNVIGDIPDYQKYFYCPKVSRAERHCGFEQRNIPTDSNGMFETSYDDETRGQSYMMKKSSLDQREKIPGQHWGKRQLGADDKVKGNNHPTVKPVELMKYLIKLVTPKGGRVLDPFNGSGSTGMAAVELGYEYVGCELDPNYVAIAERRIQGWYEKTRPDNNFGDLFD